MNILLIIILFTISCNQPTSKEPPPFNMVELEQEVPKNNIDSVIVKYWKSTEANEYTYKYSNGELAINSQYFGVDIKSIDIIIITKFITYVNEFYIDKNEKIILEKNKREYMVSSEYPSISVIGYKKGRVLSKEHTQIGYEEYDVKFNPKFLEFYEFLDSLIKNATPTK